MFHRCMISFPDEVTDWLIKWVPSYHQSSNTPICPLPCSWINTGLLYHGINEKTHADVRVQQCACGLRKQPY